MAVRLEDISTLLKRLEPRLRAEFHVRSLHVFGSIARGESGPGSDIDLIVDFDGPRNFAQFMDLKLLLEDECGTKVDLVTRDALRPALEAQILAEAKRVA
jgi:uncharacterized protein